ncbi:MAG: serpin family protein [Candidatus Riflebacteria bacterium]|nr:serpin family protein [Candidatus Riflebacteria bacterium]
MRKISALALVVALFFGVGASAQDDFDLGITDSRPAPIARRLPDISNDSRKSSPSEGALAAVKSANGFALRIFKEVAAGGDNVFLSPYSIDVAFNMAMAGASDATLDEFLSVLGHADGEETAQKNTGELLGFINSIQAKGDITLAAANAIWPDIKFSLLPLFVETLKNVYQVDMQSLDFAGNKSEVVQTINSWVKEKTAGKIEGPMTEGMVDEKTGMILINAIYFKGNWAEKFEKSATRPADFHISPAKTVKVNMMRQSGDFRFYSCSEFKALEMLYAGDDLSMMVLLPAEGLNIANLSEKLSPEFLTRVANSMHKTEVIVGVPSFKLETEFGLNNAIQALGLAKAFDSKAEFKRITDKSGLFISSAIHKAFVEVNEEGTEAAAITMLEVQPESYSEPDEFIADRPFVFIIRERQTGCILFMGTLVNPPAA